MEQRSNDFELLDYGYNKASRKLVTIEKLKVFVKRGSITAEEFKLITNLEFNAA